MNKILITSALFISGFTLSDFDVRICRPDGSLANVDSDCSVIFKITSTKMIMGDNEK